MNDKLKVAIQKSGRLTEESIELLKEAGINLTKGDGKLISLSSNFPIEILYLRDDDIPQYIADNVADIGIVGENIVLERNYSLQIIERLGFAKCRLSFAIPKGENYKNSDYLNGKKIATTYPKILRDYLTKNNINAEIHEISGSVEIAPNIGLADVIFDIVSSGSTLISNGLKEVDTVLNSEAVMIVSPKLTDAKKKILDDMLFRIKSVMRARNNKYILLNAPNESIERICKILPGLKSPSILPLVEKGWSSLHSVVNENDFWEIIGKLKDAGAEGILVVPIEKMIK
jgi:ATP phosphoribosyltransferase